MTETTPSAVPRAPRARQGAGAEQSDAGAELQASVTNGAPVGTKSADRRDLLAGGTILLAVTLAFLVVNALTVLADWPDLRPWAPWLWEGSSAFALMLLIWLPWRASGAAPSSLLHEGWRARGRFLAVHLGAAILFSLLHVVLMVGMRHGVYALLGEVYDYGPPIEKFIYELRKDVLSYALFVGVFWGSRSLREARETPLRPVSFDIRDGGRLIRAPLNDILAATSAGNYVEFVLADGRRPLMRVTLSAVEGELARFGFVRTHRGWLVNAARMTGLRPEGSGDWTVELGALEAPLSRRYTEALDRLRTQELRPPA